MKGHFWFGKHSGYSLCCILWFYVRLIPIKILGLRRYYELTKKFDFEDAKHVPCPVHNVLYHLKLAKPKYHTCSYCGWQQLGKAPCRVKELHGTWMDEEIRENFRDQKKRYGQIVIKQHGKLAKKILKDLKKRKK